MHWLSKSLFLHVLFSSACAASAGRLALLIAIDDYERLPKLSASREMDVLSNSLQRAKFQVVVNLNPTLAELRSALDDLAMKASEGDTVLVYFGGHGIQSEGKNYLIPLDFDASKETELPRKAISLDSLLSTLNMHRPNLRIVILDACRDNPFSPGGYRMGLADLQSLDALPGTFLAYSAAPNSRSFDGVGFASLLSREIVKPGLELSTIFYSLRSSVLSASNRQQFPWVTDLRTADTKQFYFTAPIRKSPDAMSVAELRSEILSVWDKALTLKKEVELTRAALGPGIPLKPAIQSNYEVILKLEARLPSVRAEEDLIMLRGILRDLEKATAALAEYYESK